MNAATQSPCIQVCELGLDRICSGCFRTSDEIGRWMMFTESEREQIMQSLAKRRDEYLANCFD